MKEFLEASGYRLWKSEPFVAGEHKSETCFYQKRMDNKPDWDENIPLCNLNDKVFINIYRTESKTNRYQETPYNAFEIELCQENKDGEWGTFKISGMNKDRIENNLKKYEERLLEFWKQFAE